MGAEERPPIGVPVSTEIERVPRSLPFHARARWVDPPTKRRHSVSRSFLTQDEAQDWVDSMLRAAEFGLSPATMTMTLAEYGDMVMPLATRGLEAKTLD